MENLTPLLQVLLIIIAFPVAVSIVLGVIATGLAAVLDMCKLLWTICTCFSSKSFKISSHKYKKVD